MSTRQQPPIAIPQHLETERLIIRRGTMEDAPAWTEVAAASWTELSVYLNWAQGPQLTPQQTFERAESIDAWFEDRTQLTYFLFAKRTGGCSPERLPHVARRAAHHASPHANPSQHRHPLN